MTSSDAMRGQVVTSAAEVYEKFFVPGLFGQWAEPVLDAARVGRGDHVLDVGCGTGVLARAAAARVGPSGNVVGLDRNEGMLAVAKRTDSPVAWRLGVAEQLPFADDSFDRVVSQFVLMFLEDREAGVREMARVLKPGGMVAVATWAAVDESPGYSEMVELLRQVVGEPAAEALRAPFALGSAEAIRAVIGTALADVDVARHVGTACFESIDAWVHTEIRGWTLADALDDATYEELLYAARASLAGFADDHGTVRFDTPALITTTTKAV